MSDSPTTLHKWQGRGEGAGVREGGSAGEGGRVRRAGVRAERDVGWGVIMSARNSRGQPPTIGVLALQGDVREHLRALEAAGARAERRTPSRGARRRRRRSSCRAASRRRSPSWRGPSACSSRCAAARGRAAGVRLLRRDDPARRPDRWTAAADQETLGGIDMTVRRNAFGRQVDSFEADVHLDRHRRRPGPRGVHPGAVGGGGGPDVEVLAPRRGRPGRR